MTNAAGGCWPPARRARRAGAGRGGIAAVSETTGLARSTIGRGLDDLDAPPPGQVRRPGGGPRLLTDRDPSLLDDLKRLVEPRDAGRSGASAVVGVRERRLKPRSKPQGTTPLPKSGKPATLGTQSFASALCTEFAA